VTGEARLGLGLADPEQENALLVGIIEASSAGPELGPLASRVARLIVEATATDVCFVYMLDDSGGSLTLTGATPPFDRQVGRIRLPLGEGITGWVASHRTSAVTEDKESDPRYRHFPELGGPGYSSMVSVPMATRPGGLVGVLNVHTRDRREFSDREVRLLTSIGSLVAGAMHQGRLHRQLAAREKAAERFAEQVIAAQEAERGRLSRDIHDGIMQRLVSLTYHLDAATDAVSEASPYGAEQLAIARGLADLTLDEGRATIAGLRPPVLDDLGLADGLASLARSVAQLDVRVDAADCDLSEHAQIALYRIAQESLQNIVKHAHATEAQIRLQCDAEHAVLWVTDNGRGFDRGAPVAQDGSAASGASAAPDSSAAPDALSVTGSAGAPGDRPGEVSSYGLRTMAERAELMGGRLEVTSRPGLGTTVTAVIPLTPKPPSDLAQPSELP
jgi:two-component system, NarL family, sensor kinase